MRAGADGIPNAVGRQRLVIPRAGSRYAPSATAGVGALGLNRVGDRTPGVTDRATGLAQARGDERVTPEIEAKVRAVSDLHVQAIARAHAAGVKIAMGTDSGVFAHGINHKELAWMVRAGLSPQQSLRAATGSAAELLERSDIGGVAPGKLADLIVVGGDPWNFDRFDQNLRQVIKGGQVVRDAR